MHGKQIATRIALTKRLSLNRSTNRLSRRAGPQVREAAPAAPPVPAGFVPRGLPLDYRSSK